MFEEGLTIMANLGTEGFKRGTKEIERAVKGLAASAKRFGSQMMGTFRRLIPMIIGVGSAYGIISKGVSAFMAENEELSQRMSAIWTAVGNLLGPIIIQIIEWVSTAVSYFLSFLKLLGVTTKSASELSKKSKKNAQELQRTIAGFDELNVLQDNSGQKENPLKDLEPKEWMKQLADLLKNKLWDEAANIIVAKMNELINKFRSKAYELGQIIGEYIGGAMHILARIIKDVDWKGLGDGIARFVNGLLENIDGKDLGAIIVGKFVIAFGILTGFLANLDWALVANFIVETIVGIFETLGDAIAKADFQNIGAGIRTFFEKIWERKGEIADAFFKFLKEAWEAALKLLKGFLTGEGEGGEDPPLVKSLRDLGDSVKKLTDELLPVLKRLWDEWLKPTIEDLVQNKLPGIVDKLATIVDKVTEFIDKHPDKAVELLKGAIELIIALKVANKIKGVIDHVGNLVNALIGSGGSGGAGTLLHAVKTVASAVGGSGSGAAAGAGTLAGALATIGPIAMVAGSAIYANAMLNEQYAQITEQAFEGLGDSTEDYQIAIQRLQDDITKLEGEYDTLALCGGDLTMVDQELTARKIVLAGIMEDYSKIVGDSAQKTEDLNNATSKTGDAMKEGAEKTKQGAKDYEEATKLVSDAATKSAEVTEEATGKINEATSTNTGEAATSATTNSETMESNTTDSFESMKNDATDSMEELSSNAERIFSNLASEAYGWGVDLMSNFLSGINAMIPVLQSTLIGIANMVHSYIGFSKPEKGPLSDFDKYGPDMMELFAEGIKGGEDKLVNALSDIADTVSVRAPGVAGGALLPYGVAAASGGTGGTATGDDSYERLIGAIDSLENALIHNQWVIDFGNFRAVAKELTRVQRQMSRAEGV